MLGVLGTVILSVGDGGSGGFWRSRGEIKEIVEDQDKEKERYDERYDEEIKVDEQSGYSSFL